MNELKPCPFCGGEAALHEMRYGEGGQYSVFGVFCAMDANVEYQHGHFIDNFATEAEAVEAWNTRAERTCEMLPTHSDLEITLTSMNTGITRAWGYRQCSNCLCNVFEGAKYCPNCGAKVVSE